MTISLAARSGFALALGALAVISVIICTIIYQYERRLVPRRSGVLLLGLRLAAIAIVIVALLDPVATFTRTVTIRPRLIVGVDVSASMDMSDPGRSPREAEALSKALGLGKGESLASLSRSEIASRIVASDAFRRLAATHEIEVIAFARDAASAVGPRANASVRSRLGTDWSGVLERALESEGAPVGAVVLLSDGLKNRSTGDIQARFVKSRIPVLGVLIGSSDPPRDAAVAALRAPERVRKGDVATVEAELKLDLPAGESVVVTLKAPNRSPIQKSVRAGTDRRAEVAFPIKLETPGKSRVSVTVGPVAGDAAPDNDERALEIAVVDDRPRLLIVASEPTWEFRYLRDALARDPGIDFDAVVFHQPRSSAIEPLYPERLPADEGEPSDQRERSIDPLGRYDAIFAVELEPFDLKPDLVERLDRSVGDAGGTLVISSPATEQGASALDRWGKLVPVASARPLSADAVAGGGRLLNRSLPAGLAIAPEAAALADAAAWPMLRIFGPEAADIGPERLRERWIALPPQPALLVGEAKPGAVSAARASAADSAGGGSVIAAQNFGLGKTLWIGSSGIWRLRYRAGDSLHSAFWKGVLRWSERKGPSGGIAKVRFGPIPSRIYEDQPIAIEAWFADPLLAASLDTPAARLVSLASPRAPAPAPPAALAPASARPGVLAAELPPLPPGTYRVVLDAPGLAEKLDPDARSAPIAAEFEVLAAESPERIDLAADRGALAELAAATGGKLYAEDRFDGPARDLQGVAKTVERKEERSIWDHPLALVALTLTLTLEWLVRKKLGLP